ncbi:MAG TPA: polymorphic toxin type 17 domain-containing protein, partial [Vampirovibrionales bacterium]
SQLMKVTSEHRILVNGIWKEAGEIKIGDKLLGSNRESVFLLSVKEKNEEVPVYNFEVEDTHTYIANNVVVHNDCFKFDKKIFFGLSGQKYWVDEGTKQVFDEKRNPLSIFEVSILLNNPDFDSEGKELILDGLSPEGKELVLRFQTDSIKREDFKIGVIEPPIGKGVKISKGLIQGTKTLLKKFGLPTKGKIRFIPPKTGIKRTSDGGFVDKFGNIWRNPKGNIIGEKHWDVNLSNVGKNHFGRFSPSGNHINVTKTGKIHH